MLTTTKILHSFQQEVVIKVLLRLRKIIGSRQFAELMSEALALREFESLCTVYGFPRVSSYSSTTSATAADDLSRPEHGHRHCIAPNDHNGNTTEGVDAATTTTSDTGTGDDDDYDDGLFNHTGPTDRLYMGTSAGASRTWQLLPGNNVSGQHAIGYGGVERRRRVHPVNSMPVHELNDTRVPTVTKRKQRRDFRKNLLRPSSESVLGADKSSLTKAEKIILETEINIDDGRAVTMRILEGPMLYTDEDGDDDDFGDGVSEHSGLVRILTDSELEDSNRKDTAPLHNYRLHDESDDTAFGDTLRTPRRVTFGGEIVKMRTPDSDSLATVGTVASDNEHTDAEANAPHDDLRRARTRSADAMIRRQHASAALVPTHKQIEVLHNLQRSPQISPSRMQAHLTTNRSDEPVTEVVVSDVGEMPMRGDDAHGEIAITWEELGLVDDECLHNLQSGVSKVKSHLN